MRKWRKKQHTKQRPIKDFVLGPEAFCPTSQCSMESARSIGVLDPSLVFDVLADLFKFTFDYNTCFRIPLGFILNAADAKTSGAS
jgi:hypothetical protein